MSTGTLEAAGNETDATTNQAPIPILFDTFPDSGSDSIASASQYNPPDLVVSGVSARELSLDIASLLDDLHKSAKGLLEQENERFNRNLLDSFELEPVEEGYPHPAERIIEVALKNYNLTAIDWIKSIYLRNVERPTVAAGILRCIGRLSSELTSTWGMVMAVCGLLRPDIEIREAAVRALEMWGGFESLASLKGYVHMEKTSWLKEYIEQVIVDLSE